METTSPPEHSELWNTFRNTTGGYLPPFSGIGECRKDSVKANLFTNPTPVWAFPGSNWLSVTSLPGHRRARRFAASDKNEHCCAGRALVTAHHHDFWYDCCAAAEMAYYSGTPVGQQFDAARSFANWDVGVMNEEEPQSRHTRSLGNTRTPCFSALLRPGKWMCKMSMAWG